MIEEAGFSYAPPAQIPNSHKSLELAELARDNGRFGELHVKLFSEHWSQGGDIGDTDTLLEIAASVGLPEDGAREALSDGRYRDRIEESTQMAREFEINGIPAWVIDYKLLLMGAQPLAVFDDAMDRLGYHPLETAQPAAD